MNIEIRTGEIEDCLAITALIPEFTGTHYSKEVYEKRLYQVPHLILIATIDGAVVGFKVAYEIDKEATFYSWMGGVIPNYRKMGVAKALAREQERLLRKKGYAHLEFKTRNYLKPMLLFAISNGFHIIEIEKRLVDKENRIILRKEL